MEDFGSYIYYVVLALYGLYKLFTANKNKKTDSRPPAPSAEESWEHEQQHHAEQVHPSPFVPEKPEREQAEVPRPVRNDQQRHHEAERKQTRPEVAKPFKMREVAEPMRVERVSAKDMKAEKAQLSGRAEAAAERIMNAKNWEERIRLEAARREGLIKNTRMAYEPLQKRALIAKTLETKKKHLLRDWGNEIPDTRDLERALAKRGGDTRRTSVIAQKLKAPGGLQEAVIMKEVLERKY